MTAVADVLKTIAEDKSLVLFNAIALSNNNSDILIRTLHLSRKQYYARLSALLKAGLVKREMAKYYLRQVLSGRIHLYRGILFVFYYEFLAAHMSHLIFHIVVFVSKGYQRLFRSFSIIFVISKESLSKTL